MKKLLLSSLALAACLGISAQETLYVVGNKVNDQSIWDPVNEMTYANGVYTWEGNSLGSGFKICDATWSEQYNIGSNGSDLVVGTPYYYALNGGNIALEGGATTIVNNPKLTLDLNAATILLEGTIVEAGVSLTLAGSFNSWNGNDSQYTFTYSNGKYVGTFTLSSTDKFQVVLNGGTWFGSVNGDGTFDMAEAPVTKSIGTGYQNDFSFSNFAGGPLTFSVDWDAKTLTISADGDLPDVPVGPGPEEQALYIISNFGGWNINDPLYPVRMVSEKVYSATYDLDPGTIDFRFYTQLGNWNSGSIGAGEADETDIPITLTDGKYEGAAIIGGKSNWEIEWGGGNITFTVNLNNNTVLFEEGMGAVGKIGADINAPEVIYNLQGQRVNRAEAATGIYIINGKKTLLR